MGRVPLLLPLVILLAGIMLKTEFFPASSPAIPAEETTYSAKVESVEEKTGSRLLICNVNGIGLTALRLYGAEPLVFAGNSVVFTSRLQASGQRKPVVPDEVMFSRSGIVAEGQTSSSKIRITSSDMTYRQQLTEKILASGVNDETGAMLCALLLGDENYLNDELRGKFSAVGLAHVLALSGLHVGIIAVLISAMLWPLYMGRHNRSRLLVTIVALWAYAALTGFAPSVTRAVIMATVYMTGRILQRDSVPLNSLCLAAIIILALNPESLFTIGFQLSFAAVAGILLFSPLLNRIDRRNHPWLFMLWSYPVVSIAAMSLTGIISAWYFHSYPLYFLVANLVMAPIVPIFICGGALLLFMELIDVHWPLLYSFLDGVDALCSSVATTIASWPGHEAAGLYWPLWLVVTLVVSLLVIAIGLHRKRTVAFAAGAGTILLAIECAFLFPAEFPQREHYFLNDHSAANILIRDGSNLYLLTSTNSEMMKDMELNRAAERFKHYMSRRGLSDLKILPDTFFSPYVSRRGDCFAIDGTRYRILDHEKTSADMTIDYLIVANGFKGDIVEESQLLAPSKGVILSSSLNLTRLKRYHKELTENNITTIIH